MSRLEAAEEAQLRALEEDLWREETRFDAARMDELLAPDFVEIGKSGRQYSRQDVLEVPRQPLRVCLPLPDFQARWVAPEAALVTYASVVRAAHGAQHARRASLWTRAGGRWRLRFHQGTPLPVL